MNPHVLLPPLRDKVMKLYKAASDNTIGSMLAQEDENGVEGAIYYLRRVLNDAEQGTIHVKYCAFVCISLVSNLSNIYVCVYIYIAY
jgi:hypothetical protein